MRGTGSTAGLDQTLLALADPIRRRILERLTESEARITTVAAEFAISLNSVSKHIRILERADLVQRRITGREHILSFSPAPLDAAQKWIVERQSFWASRLQALDDYLTAEETGQQSPMQEENDHVEDR